jgi:serine protease AprX
MMTSVVCAGDGSLSGGKYRGLASQADLVLVKVGTAARIRHEDIQQGFEWVRANREAFGIQVVNVSCGGDWEGSYLTDPLSRIAEECVRDGLVVVAAAGNRRAFLVTTPDKRWPQGTTRGAACTVAGRVKVVVA